MNRLRLSAALVLAALWLTFVFSGCGTIDVQPPATGTATSTAVGTDSAASAGTVTTGPGYSATPQSTSTRTAVDSPYPSMGVVAVQSERDLPDCDRAMQGVLLYLVDGQSYVMCSVGIWIPTYAPKEGRQ